jgi:hypothetical protein
MNHPINLSALCGKMAAVVPCLVAVFLVTGCASTTVTGRERIVKEKLPRPDHIFVYDFVANPADVPADSVVAGQVAEPTTPLTPEEIEEGHQLGIGIAAQLAQQLREMGLPAEQAVPDSKPQINDIVIRGYLLSIDEGSATKRVMIGFGSGSSQLTTAVEGFQMTADGLRKIGSGKVQSGGSKGPGAALGIVGFIATANPAGLIVSGGMKAYGEVSGSSKIQGRAKATAKLIADQLKIRAQQEGWIE